VSKKDLLYSSIFIGVIVVALILFRTFVFTPVNVIGNSMDPTLKNGERLIALNHEKAERFDIVTFNAPDDPNKVYIKRVIGLPGDKIEFMDDVLYINGKIYHEPYLEKFKQKNFDGEPFTYDFNLDKLFGEKTVPKGKVFLLGDNRRVSKDSRVLGFVNKDKLRGVIKFAFWPLEKFGPVTNP
jgi:signal peptidase I